MRRHDHAFKERPRPRIGDHRLKSLAPNGGNVGLFQTPGNCDSFGRLGGGAEGFRTANRCVRECLAFAKKFEAKAPVPKNSEGKLEEAVAAFSAALWELTQAAAATIGAR